MIVFENVSKSYPGKSGPVPALTAVSFQIQAGECVGIAGQSGEGKSTLLRLINRLDQPSFGRILVEGTDLATLNPQALRALRKKVGFIFQQDTLVANLNVHQNILLPLKFDAKAGAEDLETIATLTGISDKLEAFPCQLSGGQRQRVAIARALLTRPSLLLCDEISASLDDHTALGILQLLQDINQRYGTAILFVSHRLADLQFLCRRVLVLADHQLQADFLNPKQGLYPHGKNDYLQTIREAFQ